MSSREILDQLANVRTSARTQNAQYVQITRIDSESTDIPERGDESADIN